MHTQSNNTPSGICQVGKIHVLNDQLWNYLLYLWRWKWLDKNLFPYVTSHLPKQLLINDIKTPSFHIIFLQTLTIKIIKITDLPKHGCFWNGNSQRTLFFYQDIIAFFFFSCTHCLQRHHCVLFCFIHKTPLFFTHTCMSQFVLAVMH